MPDGMAGEKLAHCTSKNCTRRSSLSVVYLQQKSRCTQKEVYQRRCWVCTEQMETALPYPARTWYTCVLQDDASMVEHSHSAPTKSSVKRGSLELTCGLQSIASLSNPELISLMQHYAQSIIKSTSPRPPLDSYSLVAQP